MDYKLLSQFKKFFLTSGIGWIIDFMIYSIITAFLHTNVLYANIFSSIPAVTFVFIVSTRKNFSNKSTNISLKIKYIIYIIYQMILLLFISNLGQYLFNILIKTPWLVTFLGDYIKIVVKIIITPITMISNFLFMKGLIEKL